MKLRVPPINVELPEAVTVGATKAAQLLPVVTAPGVIQLEVAPLHLPIEVALPCGMLLTELLTNAYKYAFPGERTGTLRVELQAQENQFRLVVQDDGVGLPEGMDPQSPEGFGLRLVANLAGQLGAELHFERGVGLGIFVVVPFTAHFAAPPLANRAERQAQ